MTTRRGPRRHFLDPGEWDDNGQPTATVAEVICRELGRGLPQEMAARFAGANYATFRDWLVDGRRLLRRAQVEPDFVPHDADVELMEFCLAVSEAQAGWVQRTNLVLEAMVYDRRKVAVRVKTEVLRKDGEIVLDADGEPVEVEVERTTTTTTEPIDATPIIWRLGKVVPQVYSVAPRYEQESEDGESEVIDIGARVLDAMNRIAETLVIAPDE